MRLRLLSCLLLLAVPLDAAAADLAQSEKENGYRATGENIAAGTQMQAEEAVAGWIKSPGHCANLMNPAYTEMGVAFAINAASEMGIYWAQAFGTPR